MGRALGWGVPRWDIFGTFDIKRLVGQFRTLLTAVHRDASGSSDNPGAGRGHILLALGPQRCRAVHRVGSWSRSRDPIGGEIKGHWIGLCVKECLLCGHYGHSEPLELRLLFFTSSPLPSYK